MPHHITTEQQPIATYPEENVAEMGELVDETIIDTDLERLFVPRSKQKRNRAPAPQTIIEALDSADPTVQAVGEKIENIILNAKEEDMILLADKNEKLVKELRVLAVTTFLIILASQTLHQETLVNVQNVIIFIWVVDLLLLLANGIGFLAHDFEIECKAYDELRDYARSIDLPTPNAGKNSLYRQLSTLRMRHLREKALAEQKMHRKNKLDY